MTKPPSINTRRLNDRLSELAEIGKRPDGGVCRLAFSDDDLAGRNYVGALFKELGLEIRIDPVGNLFGILRGENPNLAVMIGSHTDTVATGGKYDGALGVLAAVECVERIIEEGYRLSSSLVVASFVNEEGVRYMPDMMGSLYHSGQVSIDDVLAATDTKGISVGAEVSRLNYCGTENIVDIDVRAFLELHIEQGPVLETNKIDIGVVTGVQGLSWFEVNVSGRSNHAGTTPMELREDAGVVSGALMSALRSLPDEIEGLRLTIGSVEYHPNLINVIPDTVDFTIDLRHPDLNRLKGAEQRVHKILGQPTVCTIKSKSLARVEPCEFDPSVIQAVQKASDFSGYSTERLVSGAGHDAHILQSVYPSGMIFIPSRGGISHNITEYSSPEQIVAGANVLLGAVLELISEQDMGAKSTAP